MNLAGHLQWHSEMHQKLGRRTLHFWFLRFDSHYEKDEIFPTLVDCMEKVEACAYAGYELSGEFDLMLRVWLPSNEVGRFGELLEEKVRPKTDRGYAVDEVIRHWVWEDQSNGTPGVVPCKMESLNRTTLLEDIKALNRLSEASHKNSHVQAKGGRETELLEEFMEASSIRPVEGASGIRLVIRLRLDPDISNPDQKRAIKQIAKTLDGLRDPDDLLSTMQSSRLGIREFSLYACSDGTLIALCRIHYLAWHKIREQLITPLGRISGVEQTTTYPALSQRLEVSRETLLVPDDVRDKYRDAERTKRFVRAVVPDRMKRDRLKPGGAAPNPSDLPEPPPGSLPVRDFLDREEGIDFEAKGSAFTPLEPWLNRAVDAPEEDGLKEDPDFFCESIARSIVAMLNTKGGTILIGALEADRYARDNRERLRLRLLEKFPPEGRFHLLGLQDPIYRRGRWDLFDRHFGDLLVKMVDGQFARRVSLRPGWHNDDWFALVKVQGPGAGFPSRGFCLVTEGTKKFYIRRGGRNEELALPEALEYLEDLAAAAEAGHDFEE